MKMQNRIVKHDTTGELLLGTVTMGLVGITIVSGIVASVVRVVAEEPSTTASANASVTVAEACSLSANNTSPHTTTLTNNNTAEDVGNTTFTVTCNDPSGLAIYAIGYTGDEYGNTNLVGSTGNITTGTNDSSSNWAMKVANADGFTAPDFLLSSYTAVPTTYTKVAAKNSNTTDVNTFGINATYRFHISATQPADTYVGQVKYTLVHPASEIPLQPYTATSGCINYFPNGSAVVGTMGCQTVYASDTSATLFTSNFSRTGYGFAGWSDVFDYATNPNAHFYGPNENITFEAGAYTGDNPGLSLYAVWIKSAGNLQDSSKVSQLCGTGTGSLTAATYNNENDDDESTWSITAGLSSVSALTDTRDNNTYAIAKLSDGNCWMIENLRLDNTAELTTTNTNNPLNDGTTVTLKHNYADTDTYNTLSPTSSVAYDADTAPDGWCNPDSTACDDQSRLRTDNTANRVTYASGETMSNRSVNLYSYGNYYNWYSATAGNGTYSKTSGDTVGDLCPAGWHVPTGTGSGEFGLLSNSLGGYKNASGEAQPMSSSTSPTGVIIKQRFRHFPNNTILAGFIVNTSRFFDRGIGGAFWSSTANMGSSGGKFLEYSSNEYFRPASGSISKSYGLTIRCMVSISP